MKQIYEHIRFNSIFTKIVVERVELVTTWLSRYAHVQKKRLNPLKVFYENESFLILGLPGDEILTKAIIPPDKLKHTGKYDIIGFERRGIIVTNVYTLEQIGFRAFQKVKFEYKPKPNKNETRTSTITPEDTNGIALAQHYKLLIKLLKRKLYVCNAKYVKSKLRIVCLPEVVAKVTGYSLLPIARDSAIQINHFDLDLEKSLPYLSAFAHSEDFKIKAHIVLKDQTLPLGRAYIWREKATIMHILPEDKYFVKRNTNYINISQLLNYGEQYLISPKHIVFLF